MACRLLSSTLFRMTQVGFEAMAKNKKKRYFSSSPPLWGHSQQKGIPGSNLPFDINQRYKLTLWFLIYGITGLNAPMLVLAYQLSK